MNTRTREPHTPDGPFHPARKSRTGGTVINLITAVIFFGALALGAWWIIKSWGEASAEYTGAMIDAKHSAESVACHANLRTIWQNLQMYAITNEEYPPSSQALIEWCGNSKLFQCPDPDGAKYIYIPGQTPDMSPENILIFEPNAVHNDHASVLRLSGKIELIPPDQLRRDVERTKASLTSSSR